MSNIPEKAPAIGLREKNRLRRVDRILEAARALLREAPDRPLTVERIAEHAEVSPATVFNVVGTRDQIWEALASRALDGVRESPVTRAEDPHARARDTVTRVMTHVCADGAVYRALLSGWGQSGRGLGHDPVLEVVACLSSAVEQGSIAPEVRLSRLGELLGAGLNGAVHQWAARAIDDDELRRRAVDLVDLVFVAARSGDGPSDVGWHADGCSAATP